MANTIDIMGKLNSITSDQIIAGAEQIELTMSDGTKTKLPSELLKYTVGMKSSDINKFLEIATNESTRITDNRLFICTEAFDSGYETGHIYGLADYYDYNSSWAPLGGIDMMDHNVGDHSAFSKFSLGWTNPWVVDKPGQIVLRSFSTSGDCFIIPSGNYNGTAFDEYLMFELVSPNGASEKDYKKGEGYSTPGYIVYRPGTFSVNTAATLAGITGFIPVTERSS